MPEDINAPHECDAKGHRSCTRSVTPRGIEAAR